MLPVLRLLAAARGLRGTALDPFRYSADRRLERQLIADYERLVERVLAELDEPRFGLALALLALPEQVRGFGPIKQAAAARAAAEGERLLEQWAQPQEQAVARIARTRASAA
jgi:indolepyruvate ferredoxin oxidoreductase